MRESLPGTYSAVCITHCILYPTENEERIDISTLANNTAVVIRACT